MEDVLRVLGASGLAGYDVFAGSYFHRVLPFDLSMADDLHPRLVDAKALIESGAVSVVKAEPFEADVRSGDAAHRVRDVDGDLRCTCPWFAKHRAIGAHANMCSRRRCCDPTRVAEDVEEIRCRNRGSEGNREG